MNLSVKNFGNWSTFGEVIIADSFLTHSVVTMEVGSLIGNHTWPIE